MKPLLPWESSKYYIFLGECVRVALLIHNATRRHVICGLSGSTIFFEIIS